MPVAPYQLDSAAVPEPGSNPQGKEKDGPEDDEAQQQVGHVGLAEQGIDRQIRTVDAEQDGQSQ
jgi:hypothetical protein